MAEADCDRPRVVTSSSSQHQQTSGDDPLLCPLQQHGTNCHQTSGICSRWGLSNTDWRLICLTGRVDGPPVSTSRVVRPSLRLGPENSWLRHSSKWSHSRSQRTVPYPITVHLGGSLEGHCRHHRNVTRGTPPVAKISAWRGHIVVAGDVNNGADTRAWNNFKSQKTSVD